MNHCRGRSRPARRKSPRERCGAPAPEFIQWDSASARNEAGLAYAKRCLQNNWRDPRLHLPLRPRSVLILGSLGLNALAFSVVAATESCTGRDWHFHQFGSVNSTHKMRSVAGTRCRKQDWCMPVALSGRMPPRSSCCNPSPGSHPGPAQAAWGWTSMMLAQSIVSRQYCTPWCFQAIHPLT